MSSSILLQELLSIRTNDVLFERVDHMLDGLRTHFSNENNPDPVKVFSSEDLETTAYQLAGLNFIFDQEKKVSDKLPEFKDVRILHTFMNELDEPRERKLFNNRTQTAGEFLTFIGKKYGSSDGKNLLKLLANLKKHESVMKSSDAIVAYVSKLEHKLQTFNQTVR